MLVDGRAAEPGDRSSAAIIVALRLEQTSLRRSAARRGACWRVELCGPGAVRAADAAARALAAGASGLVSWGLAGGIDAKLAPGAVVLPRRVAAPDGPTFDVDRVWHDRLVSALAPQFDVCRGDLLTVPAALATPAAKRAVAAATGAAAVDMESSAIAAAAAAAGVPFIALRVVVDTLADALPERAEEWIDAHGRQRLAPALGAVLQPARWAELLILGRRYRVARKVLERLAAVAAARHLLTPPGRV